MKYPIQEKDLNKDVLYYDVKTNNENYIKWITRGEGGSFEDFPTGLYAENNNNVATTSQENIFTNENQNDIDILAATAGYNTSNITNKCFTAPPSLQNTMNFSGNSNIEQSTERNIVNETSDEKIPQYVDNLNVCSRIPESYTPEEPAIKKDSLEQSGYQKTEIEENEEPRDSIRKEDADEELTDTNGQPTDTVKEEPPDNMGNKDKSNIGYDHQLLSIDRVNYHYQTKKWDGETNWDRITEIRPHFININNKNEKTINIRDNHYINITNNQQP